MKHHLLPLCLVTTTAATSAQSQAFEVLSLQHLCGPTRGEAPPIWGSMLQGLPRSAPERNHDLLGASEAVQAFAPDNVIEMMRSLHGAAIEQNRLHVDGGGDNVVVFGETAEVATVKSGLMAASNVICRPIQIELAVWDATDRETPAPVLSAADFQRFVTNRTALWRCLGTTQPDRAVTLAKQRWTRYVRDIDVEVAQKQTFSRPMCDNFGEGAHAVVRPMPLLGDEFALHVQFVVATRRGIVRTLQTGMPGAADLELPQLETCYGACSAQVQNGGALVATMRGHATGGGQFVLTFRITSRTPPQSEVVKGLGIFPCGAITSSALFQRLAPPSPLLGEESPTSEEIVGCSYLPTELLIQFLRAAHPAELEGEDTSIQSMGGFLFVRAKPEAIAKVGATLRSLQDRLVRQATVVHQGILMPADESQAATNPTLHEMSLPTLFGRELTVARVAETTIIDDIYCEIAQEAATLDPNVRTLQAGTWLRARVAPTDQAAHLHLLVQSTHAPTPAARTLMPGGGVLMPTEIATTEVGHDGLVPLGQTIDHGDGPSVTIDGRIYRSALSTTVRW